MALIRPTPTAAILIATGVVAVGVSAWAWTWSRAERPADIVALRFFVGEPSPPSSGLQPYIARILASAALHFDPAFVSAPQALPALTSVDLTTAEALELALSLPAPRPASSAALTPPAEQVPLPLPRPRRWSRFIPDDHVFNEAQIVSFEQRLKLTGEQQRLWEIVELELRALSWRRAPAGSSARPTLDISALQRLKFAFDRLVQELRDEQKREVRQLMGIVGL